MKIKINENETYEIQLNEEVSLHDLEELVRKIGVLSGAAAPAPSSSSTPSPTPTRKYVHANDDLKDVKCLSCGSQRLYKKGFTKSGARRVVCKNCKISFVLQKEGEQTPAITRRKPTKWSNKDEVVEALKIHYFGKKEEKLQFAKNKGTSWENIMKAIHVLRKRFNITPQEVGLEEFPKKSKKINTPIQSPQSFNQIPTPQPPLEIKKESAEESEESEEEELSRRMKESEEEESEESKASSWWNRNRVKNN